MSLYRLVGGLTLLTAVLILLAWACGGGGDLLVEETAPAATRTPAIFQRSPVAGSPTPTGSPVASPTVRPTGSPTAAQSPAAANVTPEANPFEITVDAANSGLAIRERPSTSDDTAVLGRIFEGHKARVIGQARGQEVEPGKGNVWYQVEITIEGELVRGFVYSPFVQRVEGAG